MVFFVTACGLREEIPHKEEDDSSYDLFGDYELTEHQGEVLDEFELKIKEDLEGSVSTRGRLYKNVVKVNYIVKCECQPIRIAYSGVNYFLTTKSQLKSFIQPAPDNNVFREYSGTSNGQS